MFAKQLQHDINGIKSRSLGDLKVTDVDMNQIMPSNILKTFKGVNINMPQPPPPPPAYAAPPPQPARLPDGVVNLPHIISAPSQANSEQFEFDFDKKVRYEDIMEAIEKLDNKITILTNKFNELTAVVDKKKLKKAQDNGTQAG
jgi:hypothetical protein